MDNKTFICWITRKPHSSQPHGRSPDCQNQLITDPDCHRQAPSLTSRLPGYVSSIRITKEKVLMCHVFGVWLLTVLSTPSSVCSDASSRILLLRRLPLSSICRGLVWDRSPDWIPNTTQGHLHRKASFVFTFNQILTLFCCHFLMLHLILCFYLNALKYKNELLPVGCSHAKCLIN